MALAFVTTSTNRSTRAVLDAVDEWTEWVFVPAAHLLDFSLVSQSLVGTIKLQRATISGEEFLTDEAGNDLEWTGDATPVIQQAAGQRVRAYMTARTSGVATVTLRVGARE